MDLGLFLDEKVKEQALEVCEMVLELIVMLIEQIDYKQEFIDSQLIEVLISIQEISKQVEPTLIVAQKAKLQIETQTQMKSTDSQHTQHQSSEIQSSESQQQTTSTQLSNTSTNKLWSFGWLKIPKCLIL